jgi:type II secretory pathway pseudopilin PulG
MINKKNIFKRSFTLIEMLAAMAIFMVISVIMMQFFSSAQQIISKSGQRDEAFANVRIAFDMITRDIQGALYNNHDGTLPAVADDYTAIYPFLFQRITTGISNNYYNINSIDWNCLNFIATTDIANSGTLKICELRYSFVPANEIFKNPDGNDIEGGWLIRSCTADNAGTNGSGDELYNFSENYLRSTAATNNGRVNKIWIDTGGAPPAATTATQGNPSYVNFQKVIPYVYNFEITCYDSSMTQMTPIDLATATSSEKRFGSKFPIAIKLELQLLSSVNWKLWKKLIDHNKFNEADKIIKERLMRFNKFIYLPPKDTL